MFPVLAFFAIHLFAVYCLHVADREATLMEQSADTLMQIPRSRSCPCQSRTLCGKLPWRHPQESCNGSYANFQTEMGRKGENIKVWRNVMFHTREDHAGVVCRMPWTHWCRQFALLAPASQCTEHKFHKVWECTHLQWWLCNKIKLEVKFTDFFFLFKSSRI